MLRLADNLTASRPSIRRAIMARDAAAVTEVIQGADRAGADWIDLNPGFLPPRERESVWRFLVETAEAATPRTLVLDAPRTGELALALGFCTRPPVLNMATAQDDRLGPVLDLAAGHGVPVIAATMTATVPQGSDERLALAAIIVEAAARRGIAGPDLILDPMAMPLALAGGEAHARAVIETLRAIPQVFSPAPRSVIALSNLTTATAGQRAAFAAGPFLAAAWGAGLSVAMLDAHDPELARVCRLLRVFDGARVFAPGEFT